MQPSPSYQVDLVFLFLTRLPTNLQTSFHTALPFIIIIFRLLRLPHSLVLLPCSPPKRPHEQSNNLGATGPGRQLAMKSFRPHGRVPKGLHQRLAFCRRDMKFMTAWMHSADTHLCASAPHATRNTTHTRREARFGQKQGRRKGRGGEGRRTVRRAVRPPPC